MPNHLIVSARVPRLTEGSGGDLPWGIARGLLSRKHTVVILTVATADAATRVPGLARRLRKVQVELAGEQHSLSLFEGRFSVSDPQLLVVQLPEQAGAIGGDTVQTPAEIALQALWLGAAARALASANEGLLTSDAAIGWDESSALALAQVPAAAKFFVLPGSQPHSRLTRQQASDFGFADGDELGLAALGANAAHALIVPSALAAHQLEKDPALGNRASDEPIEAVPFGADDPPFDPARDPALPAAFSVEQPDGKLACRRALVRRLSLPCGPRTLLVATQSLWHANGGAHVVQALAASVHLDILALVPTDGDRDLVEHARILSIEHPTRVALVDPGTLDAGAGGENAGHRQMLAAADACLLADETDLIGRAAAIALRYGTVPVIPANSAAGEQLVDVDVQSGTGSAVLYAPVDASAIRAALTRLDLFRQDLTIWPKLVKTCMTVAPSWTRTAELFDLLREAAVPVLPDLDPPAQVGAATVTG